MVLIAINQEKSLSSASIAESVHTNPGFVRQLMLKLKKAGLMTSVAGHARPSLSKPADQITLLDIYKAVEGDKPLLHLDTHTNPDCGVGINIQLSLQGFYNEISTSSTAVGHKISTFRFCSAGAYDLRITIMVSTSYNIHIFIIDLVYKSFFIVYSPAPITC